jgi:hypothetical protein
MSDEMFSQFSPIEYYFDGSIPSHSKLCSALE